MRKLNNTEELLDRSFIFVGGVEGEGAIATLTFY